VLTAPSYAEPVLGGIRLTTIRISADAYVCSVVGELDVHTVGELGDELAAICKQGGLHVIADLVGVTFIDTAALGLLLKTADRLKEGGGSLVVVSDDPRTLRIFEVTGSSGLFRIERTLANAVNDFAEQLHS
jgi:anti-sigma B factor antagonist